jgi:hypothetical protein
MLSSSYEIQLKIDPVAENSKSSRELWTTFKAQREKELSMLLKELKNQIDSGMLTLE